MGKWSLKGAHVSVDLEGSGRKVLTLDDSVDKPLTHARTTLSISMHNLSLDLLRTMTITMTIHHRSYLSIASIYLTEDHEKPCIIII